MASTNLCAPTAWHLVFKLVKHTAFSKPCLELHRAGNLLGQIDREFFELLSFSYGALVGIGRNGDSRSKNVGLDSLLDMCNVV